MSLTILHRAFVSSREHEADFTVFFDVPVAGRPQSAGAFLESLLLTVWGADADDLCIYNVESEQELLRGRNEAFQRRYGDDVSLFDCGGSLARVVYADPARTIFLCGPQHARRLSLAQAAVAAIDREQETGEPQPELWSHAQRLRDAMPPALVRRVRLPSDARAWIDASSPAMKRAA